MAKMIDKKAITPEEFGEWINKMFEAGLAEKDADLAIMLGYDPKNFPRIKRDGGGIRLALACSALLKGLEPCGNGYNQAKERAAGRA